MLKITLDYQALEFWWKQLSEEQKIEVSQSIANSFASRYLKTYTTHEAFKDLKNSILIDIESMNWQIINGSEALVF
jgi:uncharacterized protein HemY